MQLDGFRFFLSVDLDFVSMWPSVQLSEIKRALSWALENVMSFEKGPNRMMARDKFDGFYWVNLDANKFK